MDELVVALAVFLGSIVSGFSGFGFSAVAGSILCFIIQPVQAVSLMILCTLAPQVTTLFVLRKHISWKNSIPLIVGGTLGIPAGLYLLTMLDPQAFRRGFGTFIVALSVYMLLRLTSIRVIQFTMTAPSSFFVGSAAGVVGGLTAMPGALPVIWCDVCGITKERLRGTVQPFIFAMQVLAGAVLIGHPLVAKDKLIYHLLVALPALAVGTVIGFVMFGRVNERKFRLVVWSVLFFSGCGMMA